MQPVHRLRSALGVIATFSVSAVALLLTWVIGPSLVLGWSSTVVESGSMQPAIERGDIVVLRSAGEDPLDANTVIRFDADDGDGTIVHRISEVDEDLRTYTTRGDANPEDDRQLVGFDAVRGVGTLLVPVLGYPVLWYHEGRYLLLLVVLLGAASVIGPGLGAGIDLEGRGSEPEPHPEPLTPHSLGPPGDDQPLFPPKLLAALRTRSLESA